MALVLSLAENKLHDSLVLKGKRTNPYDKESYEKANYLLILSHFFKQLTAGNSIPMYLKPLKKLNIRTEEIAFTVLLTLSAFVLGVFLCSFDIIAHAIFFSKWEQKDIALVYLFSGGMGLVLFFIYSFLHKRISFKLFHFLTSLLILVITIGFTIYYFINPGDFSSFFLMVAMFPVNVLALLTFWRYQRKIVLPEQTKRIFPLLEAGLISGIAAAAFSTIPLLWFFNYQILAAISVLFLIISFLAQFPLNLYHRRNRFFNHRKEHVIPVRSSIFILWTTRYTRNLLLFALASAILGFYLHFGFINLTRIRFIEIQKFSMFYGLVVGAIFLVILFIDRVLVHRILYSYDSPYSLVLPPVGLMLVIILSIIGMLILKRSTTNNPLPYLIILFGINKIVYETSKNVIQIPSFWTLYRTLDIRFLQIIYPRIEGMVIMLGLFITGGILIGIYSLISDLLLFLLFAAVLTMLWLWLSIRLIKSYKQALQESYKKLRMNRAKYLSSESYAEKIRKILVGDDPVQVINAMQMSARIEPLTYEKALLRMLANPQPVIQGYVLECIQNESLIELLPELRKIAPRSEESSLVLNKLIEEFEKKESLMKKGFNLEQLVNSRNVRDRILAAEIIGARKDKSYTSALVNLTREFEPDVKIAAVKAMARMSDADHSYLLIELLMSPEYHAYAFEALIQIGDPALDYLERLFINPNTDDGILSRVIRIYGKIGTEKAVDLLLNKLENQSRRITEDTITALHEANFQANSVTVHRILNILVRTLHVIGWDYLIYTSLPGKEKYAALKMAYDEEIQLNNDLLFDLLALAYNSRTIHEIKELLEHGSSADISHAIELLDHFVYEDIKPVLFPVIENISAKERVRRLQYYFPIESMTEEEMISSTLTRDYNILSIYPRICAMQLALEMSDFGVSQELIANLFHPNRLLREVAAMVIHKMDPELYENVSQRLDEHIQYELKETLTSVEKNDKLLLIERFNILKNVRELSAMNEGILTEFAIAFREVRIEKGTTVDLQSHAKEYALFLIVEGDFQFVSSGIQELEHELNHLYYSRILVNAGIMQIKFTEGSTLLLIDDYTIETLLFDHAEVANCVLSCIEQFKLAS